MTKQLREPVFCFLPCRAGSQRVPRKNIIPFAKFSHGLFENKIKQLLQSEIIARIFLSSNDDELLSYAKSLDQKKLVIHKRSEILSSSTTSTDALTAHALSLIGSGHILWTHVTSPFFDSAEYDSTIETYFQALEDGYDSLMTVTKKNAFFWNKNGPLNYDRNIEKWPRTQTLEPLYEVNSAAFLAPVSVYAALNDRIGKNPFLCEVNSIVGMDIDWPEDFQIAEILMQSLQKVGNSPPP